MIRSSQDVIRELIDYGVDFAKEDGELVYTREGCHSKPRILFHEDITGEEITGKLLKEAKKQKHITIMEHMTMLDLVEKKQQCHGVVAVDKEGEAYFLKAGNTILASGGIGGLYKHSTNYPHLTGDALAIAKLYGADGKRFANEVLPRDLLTEEIRKQMEKDGKPYVWLDMTVLGEEVIKSHFPHIYEHCLEEGYDVTKDWIPVVPAQHYFMGGIHVDQDSRTSLKCLYAVGETSCNGVHGANRLASNSLLESLVFARRAVWHLLNNKEADTGEDLEEVVSCAKKAWEELQKEKSIPQQYRREILEEIERVRKAK